MANARPAVKAKIVYVSDSGRGEGIKSFFTPEKGFKLSFEAGVHRGMGKYEVTCTIDCSGVNPDLIADNFFEYFKTKRLVDAEKTVARDLNAQGIDYITVAEKNIQQAEAKGQEIDRLIGNISQIIGDCRASGSRFGVATQSTDRETVIKQLISELEQKVNKADPEAYDKIAIAVNNARQAIHDSYQKSLDQSSSLTKWAKPLTNRFEDKLAAYLEQMVADGHLSRVRLDQIKNPSQSTVQATQSTSKCPVINIKKG